MEDSQTKNTPIKTETNSDNSFHSEIGKIVVDAENGIDVTKNFFVNSESIAKVENGTVLEYSGYTSEGEDVDKKAIKHGIKSKMVVGYIVATLKKKQQINKHKANQTNILSKYKKNN